MKKFTKLLGIVLIIALVLSMGITAAFAEGGGEGAGAGTETGGSATSGSGTATTTVPTSQTIPTNSAPDASGNYTISVASTDTHTYTVYQILTGTLIPGEQALGNPVWGADAKTTAGTNTGVDTFIANITASGLSNTAINAYVEAELKTNATGRGTVDKDTSLDVVPGYYLVVDTTAAADLADGDAYSLNIVAVFNDITITPKKGTTTSEKHVDDQNDSLASDHSELKDSADYDIGDSIPYTLTFTLPADYSNYGSYKVTFVDDMSAGLTLNTDSVKIAYGSATPTQITFTADSSKTSEYDSGTVYTYTINDLKTSQPNLDAGTVITITYTATLNANAVIGSAGNPNKYQVEYSNNPNKEGKGTTPWDKNIVFTYKTVFNKVDGDNKPLTGADFTLYKKIIDATAEGGFKWVSVTALNTGTNAANPTKVVTSKTTGEGADAKTTENCVFTFSGLDAGVYKLEETTTPQGFNTIDPIEFTITATHDLVSDDPKLTDLSGAGGAEFTMTAVKDTDDNPTGELTADIVNNSGTVLPSTGGIGTTIFYVVGSILVVAAGVLLITKKRMGRE